MTTEYCEDCKVEIKDEDFVGGYESRGEFWGAPCQEAVVTGYTCQNCGHHETF